MLIAVQRRLIARLLRVLAAVDAIGDGVLRPVERRRAERRRRLFVCRARALHRLFHLLRADIGDGREDHAQQRQMPVVDKQHDDIARQRHAGVEHLGGEFAYALRAVIHIGDGLGHQLARALLFQRAAALADEVRVEHALHAAVDVVGEPAHIKPLDEPRRLHQQRHEDVPRRQRRHRGGRFVSAENIRQTLRQPALKPRPGQQTDVIRQPGKRNQGQRQPLQTEIRRDAVRLKGAPALLLDSHSFSPMPLRRSF